jgi:hypothetical protein
MEPKQHNSMDQKSSGKIQLNGQKSRHYGPGDLLKVLQEEIHHGDLQPGWYEQFPDEEDIQECAGMIGMKPCKVDFAKSQVS